jgi:solute carrier family 6 amino acid transporter-like protein 5/7/9/14
LAHESGKSIETVVQGGTGLAFISYPEAISKFDVVPQLFAVLFFLMLFTLGVGSAVSLTGCVITVICDAFPIWKRWIITLVICSTGFLLGLVYVTPGGQHVLDVVDFFGGGFIIFVIAVIETIAISWIYGNNI